MGIRGVDIQVAIQRAADAAKMQQGDVSQARAGEAGTREEAEAQRARKQQQPRESDKTDRAYIQDRREDKKQSDEGEEDTGADSTAIAAEDTDGGLVDGFGREMDGRKTKKNTGQLDILA